MREIVGADGQPIRKDDLTRELAAPSLTGVRSAWSQPVASGLTPAALSDLLRESADGDIQRYLALAEDMEERDLHYLGVLGSRKRALSGIEITVEAVSDKAADVKLADACRALFKDPAADDLVEDLQDALGKGFSVVEILWDTSEKQWRPRAYEHRDPRWFTFDQVTRRELRLRDEADPVYGVPLAPFKFITHRPRIKSGLPIRNGYARIAAFAWLCKMYALKDWMAFAEVFGMPLRLGRYSANASADDVAVLKRAVANIGTDAAAVLPESMKIEFQQAANVSGGKDLFEGLCKFIDEQVSKAILGQTMTTDNGSSLAQAAVHNEVRLDILTADGKGLGRALSQHLVQPFIDLNFGPQKAYPRVCINVPKPENTKLLVDSIEKLVPLGLRVEASWMNDKLGVPDPDEGAVLLGAPAPSTAPAPALNRARNAQEATALPPPDALDALVEDEIADWQEQMAEIVSPVEQLAAECADEQEFLRRLPELMRTVEPALLTQALARAAFKARGLGDASDRVS